MKVAPHMRSSDGLGSERTIKSLSRLEGLGRQYVTVRGQLEEVLEERNLLQEEDLQRLDEQDRVQARLGARLTKLTKVIARTRAEIEMRDRQSQALEQELDLLGVETTLLQERLEKRLAWSEEQQLMIHRRRTILERLQEIRSELESGAAPEEEQIVQRKKALLRHRQRLLECQKLLVTTNGDKLRDRISNFQSQASALLSRLAELAQKDAYRAIIPARRSLERKNDTISIAPNELIEKTKQVIDQQRLEQEGLLARLSESKQAAWKIDAEISGLFAEFRWRYGERLGNKQWGQILPHLGVDQETMEQLDRELESADWAAWEAESELLGLRAEEHWLMGELAGRKLVQQMRGEEI